MANIFFDLARPDDDGALRCLLRENAMVGRISVTMEREPSYFAAAAVEGPFHQVAIGRDEETGEVVGMGTRSVRPMFVNGKVRDIGYLGQLRVHQRPEKKALVARGVARGFEFIRKLHADGCTPFYLTSIISDNTPARRLLTAGLPGFPTYHDYAPYHTYAIALGRRRPDIKPPSGVAIRRASADDVPAILECLERNGPRRQFVPSWGQGTLFDPHHCTPNLHPQDFFIAVRRDRVVGCLACWDQSGFKQTVVRSYSGLLGRYLRLVNTLAPLAGWPRLPAVGSPFRFSYASHLAMDAENPDLLAALLREVYNRAASGGFEYLMVGMSSGDPLAKVPQSYRHVLYRSNLYLVAWEDGMDEVRQVDSRTPGPEIAVL